MGPYTKVYIFFKSYKKIDKTIKIWKMYNMYGYCEAHPLTKFKKINTFRISRTCLVYSYSKLKVNPFDFPKKTFQFPKPLLQLDEGDFENRDWVGCLPYVYCKVSLSLNFENS